MTTPPPSAYSLTIVCALGARPYSFFIKAALIPIRFNLREGVFRLLSCRYAAPPALWDSNEIEASCEFRDLVDFQQPRRPSFARIMCDCGAGWRERRCMELSLIHSGSALNYGLVWQLFPSRKGNLFFKKKKKNFIRTDRTFAALWKILIKLNLYYFLI